MTHESFGGPSNELAQIESDAEAYHSGYTRTLREYQWAQSHGWTPTERQFVVSLSQTMRVYSAARGGKPIGGPRPDWLRGRADALRELLRQSASPHSEGR
ncbi:MAG: hypothetical protein IVW57_03780 [Ktedonobacterales bacterium]|nr:hypothetical protein [Ktedonobacterales bacterium]